MRREALLLAAAAVVLTATVGAAIVVSDESTAGDDRPGRLSFEEMTIEATEVSGSTVELGLDARLAHAGGVSENVSVELRAIDRDTGLRAATEQMAVASVEGDRELALNGSLVVEPSSDYRLETVIFEEEERVAVGHTTISGLDSLEPGYADTNVEFHQFSRAPLPSVEYEVRTVDDGEAAVATSAYLTNTGTVDETDLEVAFVARQSDSSIVADRDRVTVSRLEPGETVTPETTLEIPDEYNYHLDAIVYHEGVVVDTAREPALLDPNGTVPEDGDGSDDGDGLETQDFEFEGDDGADDMADTDDGARDSGEDSDGQPGFGPAAALLALLVAGFLAARHRGA